MFCFRYFCLCLVLTKRNGDIPSINSQRWVQIRPLLTHLLSLPTNLLMTPCPSDQSHRTDQLRCGSAPQSRMSSSGLGSSRSEEHTSELQSQSNLVCRL